ncbi:hypothetical protein [Rhodopirellula europaea]|uniref:hypothetical protein n=1 Tax=Rhodopirellula europaea TaxID=1263866 RepID=UPI003D2D321B
MRLVCIHVGKTGGVHVHRVLRDGRIDHTWLGHCTPLTQAATDYQSDTLLIGIREPVAHALSAFDARRRRPGNWDQREAGFFKRFPDPQTWCESLGTPEADSAFEFLGHVSGGLPHYFHGDFPSVLSRTWIYDTNTLTRCMDVLCARLETAVPDENRRKHNAAPIAMTVSRDARERLVRHLGDAIELYRELQPLTLTRRGV